MIVNVHRNLTWATGQGFSILDRQFRVIDRKMFVQLADCKFVVHKSGAQRAMDTGIRNVHAFVRGELVRSGDRQGLVPVPDNVVEVKYKPFEEGGFYTADDGQEIWGAPNVWFRNGAAWVL